jgi:hypothetical protein
MTVSQEGGQRDGGLLINEAWSGGETEKELEKVKTADRPKSQFTSFKLHSATKALPALSI